MNFIHIPCVHSLLLTKAGHSWVAC